MRLGLAGLWAGLLTAAVAGAVCAGAATAAEPGFVSLFNGKDLTSWVVMGSQQGWTVEKGALRSDGGRGGAWIRTDRQFANFIFRLEWMLSTVGNSGVLIRTGEKDVGPGFEVQLLAPWTPPRDDLHCTGALYGHAPANPRPDETPNRWRQMEIACRWKQITVSVDGEVCCHADMDQVPSLRNAALRGYVGMQDSHTGPGEWVKFRNLRIKNLDEDPAFVAEGFRAADQAVRQVAESAALRLGAPMVGPLCALLAEEDVALRRAAEGALFALVAAASVPDATKRATAVSKALVAVTASKAPARVCAYAADLLGIVGGGKETIARLTVALRDEATHEAARGALQRIPGREATRALLDSTNTLPGERRPALLSALGARRDPAAVKPLMAMARKGDPSLRTAALQALGQIGDGRALPALEAACGDESAQVRGAAVGAALALAETLRTQRTGSHPTKSGLTPNAPDPEHARPSRKSLENRALAMRLYHIALKSGVNAGQKGAALLGLKECNAPDLLPTLFSALRDAGARLAAFNLLKAMEGQEVALAVAAEMKSAEGEERALLLRWSFEHEVPDVTSQLEAAAESADEPARIAALQILASRADPAHAALFLAGAKQGSQEGKAAALTGYLGIAEAAKSKGEGDRAREMFLSVLDLAVSDPQRRRALAGLVGLVDANRLGFLSNWWLLGPFPNPQQSAYEQVFAPEREVVLEGEVDIAGQKLRWKPWHETKSTEGIVELSQIFGEIQDVACYAFAEVTSDREREVLMKIGTDDGVAVWLNGQRLAGNPTQRPLTVDQDVVKAPLVAGVNRLLLKVLQGGSRWAFCVRITDLDGKPLVLGQPGAEVKRP